MFTLNKKGFTLIELLVVIAIIGVLGSIVFAPFNEARKKGRDGKRVAELKTLQSTLTLFADDHDGCFPDSAQTLIATNAASIQKSSNKYVSATFAAKITPLNVAVLLSDTGNKWTSPKPYGFRSVGAPLACSVTVAGTADLYPYYQLAVELETNAAALAGDSDANYTTSAYGGTGNYVGLNMATTVAPETCPGLVVGDWKCVFDIDN